MAIYVDVSSAVHRKAGIGRYAASLARALADQDGDRYALFYNGARGVRPPEGLTNLPARSIAAGYKPWRLAVWLGQLAGLDFGVLMPGIELFHATEHLLPPLPKVPTVLTVHDMIFKLFPEHQKRLNYWYLNMTMPLYCRRARAIITVSECSKRDIMEHYGIEAQKIHVIYEAASPEFTPVSKEQVGAVRRRYDLPNRFLVHVGTIEPRKNLTRLVEALAILREQGTAIPLVLVGSKGWLYDSLFRRMEELDVSDLVSLTGYVQDSDLPAIYGSAVATIVPSVYEGFGLPVLEAMACGTPVLASGTSSLIEVGGDAIQRFDPYSISDIAETIQRVWSDRSLRHEMTQAGLSRAQEFSWRRTAKETSDLYQSLT